MNIKAYLKKIHVPNPDSHKGQNGKLLIIGGSELFHAASRWSLDVASKFVDMVFYASVPLNNDLIQEAKGKFWNGIVIHREEIENYIDEADCVLIGPGMTRERVVVEEWRKLLLSGQTHNQPQTLSVDDLKKLSNKIEWNHDTYAIINYLLVKYPNKKWVIDAGALQMVEPALLNKNTIVTPHYGELKILFEHFTQWAEETDRNLLQHRDEDIFALSSEIGGATLLVKGQKDIVCNVNQREIVSGGNAGMTKGGTGDVLAGLVAALYCTNDIFTAAVVGSFINKKAGDALYEKTGPFFNASDLVTAIPTAMWEEIRKYA